ncbi:MAG TPA: hypothetical protein VGE06_05095, partial [Flavisolibacter sp.]
MFFLKMGTKAVPVLLSITTGVNYFLPSKASGNSYRPTAGKTNCCFAVNKGIGMKFIEVNW